MKAYINIYDNIAIVSTTKEPDMIDFSDDGETWTELGEFTIPQAPGSAFYEGHSGPDFDGTVARYVLISVINTHGDPDCAALSELRINATITTSTNIPDGLLPIDVVASPNPASEYAIISISNNQSIDLKYTLVDMSGRLLRQGLISDNSFRLNTSNLTSGTYTVNIYNEEGSKSVLINVVK